MSQTGGDNLLIELFREEVRKNGQILADGLVALEQEGSRPERLEAMMRAAHSVKGAARVVQVPPAVDVAHAMEDCFVRAQQGQLALTSETVDVLLEGVDILLKIAEVAGAGLAAWTEGHRDAVQILVQRLQAVVREGPAPVVSPPAAAPTPLGADAASAADKGTSPPADVSPPPDATGSSASQQPPPVAEPAESAERTAASAVKSAEAPAEEGVVRVTASSLTRLMGLAGESLVETRWLVPFSKSLQQLKQLQSQLSDTLEQLRTAVSGGFSSDEAEPLVNRARQRLAACNQLLADRIGEFDRRLRNTDNLTTRLYREVISSRMRPFRDGVQGLPRLVRDLGRQLGKRAQLEVVGENTEVDRDILEKLDAPLNHLIRNALDHALEPPAERLAAGKPETGRLRVEAAHRAGLLSITVADDGRGIDLEKLRRKVVERGHTNAEMAARLGDAELLDFLFLPGFSTSSQVSEISGRGVGLDVVHTMVQGVGGRVHIRTQPGRGTSFHLELPVTLSVLRAVIVTIAGEPYAFPHNRIGRVIRLARGELRSLENRQYFELDGQNVGVVLARQIFQLDGSESLGDELVLVVFGDPGARYGLVVDSLLGEQDLVVRPLDRRLGKVPNLHAAAILDDGSPVLIVDADDVRRTIEKLLQVSRLQRAEGPAVVAGPRLRKRVLVVDDSITVREVERQLLANQGYEVEVAVDGMEGWNLVREGRFDLVVSDIDMPRLNGLELVRRIKADPRFQSVPVVIVSYKDRDDDRLRGLEAGANYYLTKSSFHDDTLVRAVHELIGDPGG